VDWLAQCRILPPDSKLAMRNGNLTDLALFLKDGVALCQLLNRLKPRSIDNKAFSHRPQTSQVLVYISEDYKSHIRCSECTGSDIVVF